jgi:hypothetical protein
MTKILRQPPKKLAFPPKKTDDAVFTFTESELVAGLADPLWRMSNLYHIIDKKNKVIIFRPNEAQMLLWNAMWYRNVIPKARKLGLSTFVQLFMLDTSLFSSNTRAKVIAQDLNLAEGIFRDVFKFAYDKLPEPFKIAAPTVGDPSKSKIEFTNNSIVEVTSTARGMTPTILHISELGKIAAKDPGKAKEIITGSITSAPEDAMIFVESTSEGASGEFYDMVQTAARLKDSGKPLWKLDFKLHFFAWHQDPSYVAPLGTAVISDKDNELLDAVEQEMGVTIRPEQREWYVKYRDATFSGNQDLMYQEMPGSITEAFKTSLEGAYFKEQFAVARKQDRIGNAPYNPSYPVSTFWDLGQNDMTAIWLIQACRTHYSIVGYVEDCGEPYEYFVRKVDAFGYPLGFCYLPHDSNQRRQGATENQTPLEMLQSVAPHWRIWPIDRTPDKITNIQQARSVFPLCTFDERGCKQGIKRLEAYRKEFNDRTQTYRDTPKHDINSNAADAYLLFAKAVAEGSFSAINGGPGGNYSGGYEPEPVDMGY